MKTTKPHVTVTLKKNTNKPKTMPFAGFLTVMDQKYLRVVPTNCDNVKGVQARQALFPHDHSFLSNTS